jgi:hypothetical protein
MQGDMNKLLQGSIGLLGLGLGAKYSSPGAVITETSVVNIAKSPAQLGREGEAISAELTGTPKNTKSWVVNGNTRVPDHVLAQDMVTRDPLVVFETKMFNIKLIQDNLEITLTWLALVGL